MHKGQRNDVIDEERLKGNIEVLKGDQEAFEGDREALKGNGRP